MNHKIDVNNQDMDSDLELWVEKYKPNRISQFLGNHKNIQIVKKWMTDFQKKDPNLKPILLLVGEPGTGKTTLAHLLLKEFKYNTIEINASCLEGKNDIHRKFDNVTRQGIDIIYSKKTKNGVVLDEVDGMAQNDETMREFINIVDTKNPETKSKSKTKNKGKLKKVITNFGFDPSVKKGIKSKNTSNTKQPKTNKGIDLGINLGKDLGTKSVKSTSGLTKEDKIVMEFDKLKKKKLIEHQKFPYQYPVICTANRLNDNRMKILCRHSLIVKIDPPSKPVLIKLAKKILKNENIQIEVDGFNILVERAHNDFRQLISNIQLVANKKDVIKIEDVDNLIKGRDIDQNLSDIVNQLMNKENDVETIISLAEGEKKSISNTIYHNMIDIIDVGRMGKRKEKITVIAKMMDSLAEGQQYNSFMYSSSLSAGMTKNIVVPILTSYQLRMTGKTVPLQSYNILNYRSQESRNYDVNVSYFIGKFGSFDTKTIFQLCYIIISSLATLVEGKKIAEKDMPNNHGFILMLKYELDDTDIDKMIRICVIASNINQIQSKISTKRFKKCIVDNLEICH